jgi:hypothetical protein
VEKKPMGNPGNGWNDCGWWSGAHFWRYTPECEAIPQEAIVLLRKAEKPAVEFRADIAVQQVLDDDASLYVAMTDDRIVGVLMVYVVTSPTLGQVLHVEACSFHPGHAVDRYDFLVSLAKVNECKHIRAISSRPLQKVFPAMQPCEAVFYAKVES